MGNNEEFIQEFVEEAIGHIDSVESGLLKIGKASSEPDNINTIFRAMHSIKGTASFFGLKNIVELSHSMENILGELRNDKLRISQEMVDILLESNDCLKGMIEDVNNSESVAISSYMQKLAAIQKAELEQESRTSEDKATDKVIMEEEQAKPTNVGEQIIHNGVKHGHKLYLVQLKLDEDLTKNNISTMQFLKKVEAIGNVLESNIDLVELMNHEENQNNDVDFVFLITTVLEKQLLPIALGISEYKIQELNINTKKEELTEIVKKCSVFEKDVKEHEQGMTEEQENNLVEKKIQGTTVEDSIRVHITLLNNLLNLASEMVLGRNQLLRAMENHRKDIPGVEPILQNIDRITTELQEKIMQTRMQPVANIFNKFPRIIRDLSKKLGKDIDLQLEGIDVELDKSIIEGLGDPLTHLVRNAADHGLEAPSVREKSGKPGMGKVVMKAYHEGGYVNIDIVDDGAGIDVEKVKKKAIEKGLISTAEASMMGEQEILQLLFKPGFSTAEKVTDVSGRGVGMDVVKTNIEKLGGIVEIFTSVGIGTTFRLLLPLTLAIIPSLIVEVEAQKFALPQVNLQEIVRIKPGDFSKKIEYIHNSQVLRLRGRLLPIVHLAEVLGLNRTYIDSEKGKRKDDRRKTLYDQRYKDKKILPEEPVLCNRTNESNIVRILVLKIGSRRFGLAVDIIHGSEEILVKPLSRFIKDCKCYSGTTIMGDGKTAMILDPEGIIEKANLKFVEDNDDKSKKALTSATEIMREQQNLILFKCSGPETFGMDISMVSRVEEIHANEIEKIGSNEYIKFRGDSLRVIRPEDYLSVNKVKSEQEKYYVIIPKFVEHSMGILIEGINDTMQGCIKLNKDDVGVKGLTGSTILNNKIVLLINIYELFELADPDYWLINRNSQSESEATILLVEDTPFFLKQEKSYLEAAGYKVVTAWDGKEALEILQEKEIDLVVSDIQMPVMDGLELVKKIRLDKRLSSLPVIAVTSMTGDLQKKAGMEAGYDYYEFKLDRTGLLQKIGLALSDRRKEND